MADTKMRMVSRSISFSSNNGADDDDDDSTLGDETLQNNFVNKDDPYNFLAQQHLDESSSDESSYWSNSSDGEDDDDDDDSDSDESLQHGDATDNEYASDGDAIDVRKETQKKRIQRSNSTLSIDAIIKLKLSMAKKDAKPVTPSTIPRDVGGPKGSGTSEVAAAEKDAPRRRRNRRISQERQTLGSLAKKLGSSTGNEISPDVKEKISTLRRSESTNKLRVRPKRMVHIQQEGSPQKTKLLSTKDSMDMSTVKNANKVGGDAPAAASGVMMRRATIAKYGDHAKNLVKPRDHYTKILRAENVVAPMIKYDRLEDFLLPITAEDKAAFDMALVGAVRDQNLDKVKELHAQGHPLQARSQFGESLMHVCARRGTPEMLRFILQQEGVSVRTCCDYGRTPLHDAAWSADAKSLEMMKILIQECPDLLLILDKRGFMPLDYIPKERWPHACAFLDKYKSIILPTGVIFGEDSSSEEEDSDEDLSDEESSEEESDDE